MEKNATLLDIADALGISTGTVHRALHDHSRVSAITKVRVLRMAQTLGYRPNLAARYLSSKRKMRVSVNTPKGTTSFWEEVRAGISEEAEPLALGGPEIVHRIHTQQMEEQEKFAEALAAHVDGIIMFSSHPRELRPKIREASRLRIPVICVGTDVPNSGRVAVVSINARASGALAGDLMGKFLGETGKVGIALYDLATVEHAEKYEAFARTLSSLYPKVQLVDPIEHYDVEKQAYEKCRKLFRLHPDLTGIYVTSESSIPALRAARDARLVKKLTIISTDLFPALVPEIRSGNVAATIYQRPRTQGRLAFRTLYKFLAEGECPSYRMSLAPHLVVRGNLDFFLESTVFAQTTRT